MSSLTSASPGATLGVPARPGLAVPATPRFNLLMAGLSLLMAGVFVLHQWAASHNLVTDADVLPWTLLLLGTGLLSGFVLGVVAFRGRAAGIPAWRSLPPGYGLSLLGVLVFLGGALLDLLWRAAMLSYPLGDDLLRPTSLLTALGAVLIGTGPLRAVWQSSGDRGERVPWRIILPALVAATELLITLTLFTQRANPLVDTAYVATQPPFHAPLNEIYRMNADGTGQTRLLTRPGHFFWGPAWSPDGKRIAFTMGGEQDPGVLYIANPDGSQAVKLTQDGRGSYLPAWSPDGRQIAFLSQAPSSGHFGEVAVINADGSGETRLTDNGGWNYGVSWSPDGQRLVFGSRQSGTWQLYTTAADGTDQRLLDTGGGGNAPAWSPDGRRIAFTSDRTGQDHIYVVAVSDAHVQRLTSGESHNDNAVWSPDGLQIAFTSDRAGNAEIYVMQADGSGVRNLTASPGLDSLVPGWSPDGSQILYTAVVHAPPSDPFDRQSLGIAAILIQSALLIGVLLFVARRWRLPAGALALVIVLSSLAALALQDHYELLPGVILTALLAEILYALMLRQQEGTLAARPPRFRLFATLVPALFYALYLVTVLVTQGLAWTADIAAGVVLLAGATGLLISFLLLPLGDRRAAIPRPAPDSER